MEQQHRIWRLLEEIPYEAMSKGDDYNGQGVVFGCILGAVFLVMILGCFLSELCRRKFGVRLCPGTMDDARRRRALEIQRETVAQETNDAYRSPQQVRKERRDKYVPFLKPYTMVVKEHDLIVVQCEENRNETSVEEVAFDIYSKHGTTMVAEESHSHDTDSKSEQEEIADAINDQLRDIETGLVGMGGKQIPSIVGATRPADATDDGTSATSGVSSADDDDPKETCLVLPIYTEDGHPRCVDSSCSVCLMDYNVGDRVVFSTRRVCQHAFHEDCILRWLEKGKKRCPVCRHFFVPGSKMDDKSVITHDEDDRYAIVASDLRVDEENDQERTTR